MGRLRSRYVRTVDELGNLLTPVRGMDSSESDEPDCPSLVSPFRPSTRGKCASTAMVFWRSAAVLILVSILSFANVGECDLVFDDISAIKDNKDLRPTQPLINLLYNDFWGTPMSKENSHKSYRPFTVLTFRWNFAMNGLNPLGYHVVNVFLHAANCVLLFKLYTLFLSADGAFSGALLFAVHPIHTEAVTGVVGRAELLSSMFAILLFLLYANCPTKGIRRVATPLLLLLALFSKEQGITVTAIIAVSEIFCRQQLHWTETVQAVRSLIREKPKIHPVFAKAFGRLWLLGLSAVVLFAHRLRIMNGQLPVFTVFDNPASCSFFPIKPLTYLYLLPLNLWLLIFPHSLLCDYTMGTVPLVESFLDPRNLGSIVFVVAAAKLGLRAFNSPNAEERCTLLMSLSWMVIPFLPASNLLFPVGFVVAERILYMPTIGFCLLVGYGFQTVTRYTASKHARLERWLRVALVVSVFAFGVRCYMRNRDWKSEDSLFRSGLLITQANAKIFNNIGHVLEKDKNYSEALKFFQSATKAQPDDVGAWNNVGRTLNAMNRTAEAETAWRTAKDLLPQPKSGQLYQTRIAPQHLNVFLNLGLIMAKNPARLQEADQILRQAISMRSDYIDAYINRGDVLLKMNRTAEAVEVYKKALEFNADNPDVYYNLAIVHTELRQPDVALEYFNKALLIKPDHQLALLNSAVLMAEMKSAGFHDAIEQRLGAVLETDENPNALFQLGLLRMDRQDPAGAEEYFRKTLKLKNDHKSALFNIALLINNRRQPAAALPYLYSLVQYYPEHIKGWILLGDVNINYLKNYSAAEFAYKQVLLVEPENFQALHNYCVTLVEQDKFLEADDCMGKLKKMMETDSDYLASHFKTISDRLHRRKLSNANGGVPVFT